MILIEDSTTVDLSVNKYREFENLTKQIRTKLRLRDLIQNNLPKWIEEGRKEVAELIGKVDRTYYPVIESFAQGKGLLNIEELYAAVGVGLVSTDEFPKIIRQLIISAKNVRGLLHAITGVINDFNGNIIDYEELKKSKERNEPVVLKLELEFIGKLEEEELVETLRKINGVEKATIKVVSSPASEEDILFKGPHSNILWSITRQNEKMRAIGRIARLESKLGELFAANINSLNRIESIYVFGSYLYKDTPANINLYVVTAKGAKGNIAYDLRNEIEKLNFDYKVHFTIAPNDKIEAFDRHNLYFNGTLVYGNALAITIPERKDFISFARRMVNKDSGKGSNLAQVMLVLDKAGLKFNDLGLNIGHIRNTYYFGKFNKEHNSDEEIYKINEMIYSILDEAISRRLAKFNTAALKKTSIAKDEWGSIIEISKDAIRSVYLLFGNNLEYNKFLKYIYSNNTVEMIAGTFSIDLYSEDFSRLSGLFFYSVWPEIKRELGITVPAEIGRAHV